jgi:hypothetical protein
MKLRNFYVRIVLDELVVSRYMQALDWHALMASLLDEFGDQLVRVDRL